MEIGKLHKEFWLGDLRERNHLEDPDVDGRIVFLKWIFKKGDNNNNNIYLMQLGCYPVAVVIIAWTELIWVRLKKGDGLLWAR